MPLYKRPVPYSGVVATSFAHDLYFERNQKHDEYILEKKFGCYVHVIAMRLLFGVNKTLTWQILQSEKNMQKMVTIHFS